MSLFYVYVYVLYGLFFINNVVRLHAFLRKHVGLSFILE